MVAAASIILILLFVGGGFTFLIVGIFACMSLVEEGWEEGRVHLVISLSGLFIGGIALATALSYFPLFA